jgi:hypothetical protein
MERTRGALDQFRAPPLREQLRQAAVDACTAKGARQRAADRLGVIFGTTVRQKGARANPRACGTCSENLGFRVLPGRPENVWKLIARLRAVPLIGCRAAGGGLESLQPTCSLLRQIARACMRDAIHSPFSGNPTSLPTINATTTDHRQHNAAHAQCPMPNVVAFRGQYNQLYQ